MNNPQKEYIKLLARFYKSQKSINFTGIDEILLKCDFINGSIVNGIRKPMLNGLTLDKPPGHNIYKKRTKSWSFRKDN